MSHVVVNPEVDLPPRAGDEHLPAAQLEQLELFRTLKKAPSFDKFPGSSVLRRYRRGEVICRQGEAGASAFYILSTDDLLRLREMQLAAAEEPSLRSRLEGEIARLRNDLSERDATEPSNPRQCATAYLFLASERRAEPRGLLSRLWGGGRPTAGEGHVPRSIAIDGPSDIDYATRRAPLREGEVFGEMSCMTLAPRSATVVAETDCYLLEFLRNIFDHIQRDAGYQQRLDTVYRDRVLANHLKRLELLADVPDDDLALLQREAELVRVEPGQVICDEGDPSDSVYLIRSGLVQVVKGELLRLVPQDLLDPAAVARKIVEGDVPDPPPAAPTPPAEKTADESSSASGAPPAPAPAKPKSAAEMLAAAKAKAAAAPVISPLAHLWRALPAEAQAAARALAAGQGDDASIETLLSALNHRLRDRKWLSAKPLAPILEHADVAAATQLFPKGIKGLEKDWTDLEVRVGGRLVLERLLGEGLRRRPAHAGPPRTLAYLSRGDVFGEIGVWTGEPRTATCVAYDHPPDPSRSSVPVDLVRIGAAAFRALVERSTLVRKRIEAIVAERQARDARRAAQPVWDTSSATMHSPEFQEMGLIQGQKLLLIDLDRCTRCGDCVRACINTHPDGRSRLYLDGPRFDRYLVPSACRNCLNPACMIGCPVGSIQRGDDGQIVIRDWCIGCGICARQCPYDSIQMHGLGPIPSSAIGWHVSAGAHNGRAQAIPLQGHSPFAWNLELQSVLGLRSAILGTPLVFSYRFELPRGEPDDTQYQLSLTTQGSAARVGIGNREITLTVEEKQRRGENKKLECTAQLAARDLRSGELWVEIAPPVQPYDCVLDLSLVEAPAQIALDDAGSMAQVRQVTQQAVVCDLCASLATGPACVAMCPHDAAFRVDARFEFPGM